MNKYSYKYIEMYNKKWYIGIIKETVKINKKFFEKGGNVEIMTAAYAGTGRINEWEIIIC